MITVRCDLHEIGRRKNFWHTISPYAIGPISIAEPLMLYVFSYSINICVNNHLHFLPFTHYKSKELPNFSA